MKMGQQHGLGSPLEAMRMLAADLDVHAFCGDSAGVLKRVQTLVFGQAPSRMLGQCQKRWEQAERLLWVGTELGRMMQARPSWTELEGYIHSVLAAEFRFLETDLVQMELGEDAAAHDTRIAARYAEWYRGQVDRWAGDDDHCRTLLEACHHFRLEVRYAAVQAILGWGEERECHLRTTAQRLARTGRGTPEVPRFRWA